MKFSLKVIVLLGVFGTNAAIVANSKANVLAYLTNSLDSLEVQSKKISGSSQSQIPNNPDLHKTVKNKISTIKIEKTSLDKQGKEIKEILYQPKEVSTELVKSGIGWIEPYFNNDQNFKFLEALSKNDIARITLAVNKTLVFFNEAKLHQSQLAGLGADQSKTLDPRINKINKDLDNLNYARTSLLVLDKRTFFMRLFNLVKSPSILYEFNGIHYPATIATINDLKEFDSESTLNDAKFYIETSTSLLEIIETLKNILEQPVKTIGLTSVASSKLINYFNQLENMINKFHQNFIQKEPLFNQLVNEALDLVSGARLRGPENEFNEGLKGLVTGQKSQVKRSLELFANSPAVKFYVFSGAPIRNLWSQGNSLNNKFKTVLAEIKASVDLADIEKIETWFINQIFAYAVSPYTKEEELYYARIFGYVDGEVKRLTRHYQTDAELYKKSITKLHKFSQYHDVIVSLKKLRNEYFSKLYKAIAMVNQNPQNEIFKKSLSNLNISNLPYAEDAFVELTASQYALKDLIRNLTEECLSAIEANPLFSKMRREIYVDGTKKNQYLSEYMRQELGQVEKDARDYWVFDNTAEIFKHAVEKFAIPTTTPTTKVEPSQPGESIEDILRRGITGRRQTIEDEEEEEFEDDF